MDYEKMMEKQRERKARKNSLRWRRKTISR